MVLLLSSMAVVVVVAAAAVIAIAPWYHPDAVLRARDTERDML